MTEACRVDVVRPALRAELLQSVDWVVNTPDGSAGAFLSWKPACYTTETRKVSSSERVSHYGLRRFHLGFESVDSSGLALAFFGSLGNGTHVRANNVSFGGPKDKHYYNVTQYTAW